MLNKAIILKGSSKSLNASVNSGYLNKIKYTFLLVDVLMNILVCALINI